MRPLPQRAPRLFESPPVPPLLSPTHPSPPASCQVGGVGSSASTFVDNDAYRLSLYKQTAAELCDMESSAFMQVRR